MCMSGLGFKGEQSDMPRLGWSSVVGWVSMFNILGGTADLEGSSAHLWSKPG